MTHSNRSRDVLRSELQTSNPEQKTILILEQGSKNQDEIWPQTRFSNCTNFAVCTPTESIIKINLTGSIQFTHSQGATAVGANLHSELKLRQTPPDRSNISRCPHLTRRLGLSTLLKPDDVRFQVMPPEQTPT